MNGTHVFQTQTEGLRYFTSLIIEAASEGWVTGAKELFAQQVAEGAPKGNLRRYWGIVCLPILKFFEGVVEGGDSASRTDFTFSIIIDDGKMVGELEWRGIGTPGRFVHLIFSEEGGCEMRYATAKDRPSQFLQLPLLGDKKQDGSVFDPEECYTPRPAPTVRGSRRPSTIMPPIARPMAK